MRIGTLLKRPSFKIVRGCSVKKGLSCSASVSFVGFKSFSIDGTKANPTFWRASSTVKVFGAASTIFCGELFLRNSASEEKDHQFCQPLNVNGVLIKLSVLFVSKLSALPSMKARSLVISVNAQGFVATPLCRIALLNNPLPNGERIR